MIVRRLVVALAGAGVLVTTVPAVAVPEDDPASEREALELLQQAVQAGRALSYTGTQYVGSWRADTSDAALVELRHDPVTGSRMTGSGDAQTVGATAMLDPRMLSRLADSYVLEVAGPGRCTGRNASVIEARRPGGAVAGRFWVDQDSGILLRRDVFDSAGERVYSSAFVDLAVAPARPDRRTLAAAPVTGQERPARAALERLRSDGWLVPERLPHAFRLFETQLSDGVLHLAYTDGLSTLSLFAQSGDLGSGGMAGFDEEQVGGRPVWVRHEGPERVVWSGGGQVWTLVSDAPEEAVREAVAALPRDPAEDDGLLARLGRGLSRLGDVLNPFS